METGKPWVRVKMAASLDGRTALSNGQSQWVTAADARQDGHRWRAQSDAILTGIGTVVADDPRLDARLEDPSQYVRQPHKIILDSQLRISPQANILHSESPDSDGNVAKVFIVHAQTQTEKYASLESTGAQLFFLPNHNGQVDLPALMLELGRQQINVLHVEAGAKLSGALIAQDCVDELLLYYAPKLLGDGASMFALPELTSVDQARQVVFHEIKKIGETLRVVARFKYGHL
jgi:diaminohydroxyphosphoribosylaminopyrimidine deaminase / 5-amino-6-(5-phosphoribosylamino)uracil reductase